MKLLFCFYGIGVAGLSQVGVAVPRAGRVLPSKNTIQLTAIC